MLALQQLELEDTDLKIAQELERQILEGHIWDRVTPIVRAIVDPYIGKYINEDTISLIQNMIDAKLRSLGPDFPVSGVRLVVKLNPEDPLSLLMELQ